jgi:hypothetical protein
MTWLSCHGWPVKDILSQLSCSSSPCLSCSGWPVISFL